VFGVNLGPVQPVDKQTTTSRFPFRWRNVSTSEVTSLLRRRGKTSLATPRPVVTEI
jgi:hypothetical protein